MRDLLETLVKGLVEHPDEVSVEEERRGHRLLYVVRVAPSDRGNVIGRGGSTATALRTLLGNLGQRDRLTVDVEIPD